MKKKKQKIVLKEPEKKKTKKEIVKMLLTEKELSSEDEEELLNLLFNETVVIDIDKQEESKMTKGDKIADKLSEVAGSWSFIISFIVFLLIWIALNAFLFIGNFEIDPYPFTFLNLLLSCLAALQAPVIMMSQNRQAKKDSLRNHNDYRIDLKSELILECLHDEIKQVLKNQREILKEMKTEESNK